MTTEAAIDMPLSDEEELHGSGSDFEQFADCQRRAAAHTWSGFSPVQNNIGRLTSFAVIKTIIHRALTHPPSFIAHVLSGDRKCPTQGVGRWSSGSKLDRWLAENVEDIVGRGRLEYDFRGGVYSIDGIKDVCRCAIVDCYFHLAQSSWFRKGLYQPFDGRTQVRWLNVAGQQDHVTVLTTGHQFQLDSRTHILLIRVSKRPIKNLGGRVPKPILDSADMVHVLNWSPTERRRPGKLQLAVIDPGQRYDYLPILINGARSARSARRFLRDGFSIQDLSCNPMSRRCSAQSCVLFLSHCKEGMANYHISQGAVR